MDIKQYFGRIQAQERKSLDLDYLAHLQRCHVLNIHFENLDIMKKKRLSLESARLYEKLILDKRGGVCYELNGSFYLLLKKIGFHPTLFAGTVFQGDGSWGMENGHLFSIVDLEDNRYLVDVGFGGHSPRLPVPLNGVEVEDVDGSYRVEHAEEQSTLQKKIDGDWKVLYRFRLSEPLPSLESAQPSCVLTETSPQSFFNKVYFLSRVMEEGRVTLRGNSLTLVEKNEIIKTELREDEIVETAQQYFPFFIK
ncbi:arylamine N-acetyltransferase [Ammoniphilus sp. CFH 90114]|uniref:arylamine N-acetyltransferase family protein n=1 Tax=Ammoniphilus sp. CFH 90114 TaxID=2493665 RepID=UPI00100F653C|nr:arylamine N-acetyltransferase [Ammoniphilus sp. CFH 90114]RXT13490.1 acetyltransferase [Ammoniphilus sp. CFH 90114]